MPAEAVRRRVMLVAAEGQGFLRSLAPDGWEAVEASSFEQACFLLDARESDVVVVDGGLAGPTWDEALAWLGTRILAPLLVVAEPREDVVLPALRQGARWLPADLAARQPALFAGMLDQAVSQGQERQRLCQNCAQLRDSHVRVDRLLTMLWEAVPGHAPTPWFSQRHMLERLDEEVARTHRHGGPLSVVLGEIHPATGERLTPETASKLATWAASQVAQNKRRCDVAGQYGLSGFMMVLPRAEAADALGACQRLSDVLSHPPHEHLPAVHACFGLASVPDDQPSLQSLLRRAEERLDRAREVGGVVTD